MDNSYKTKRNLSRVWPFGLIWLITGCVFLFIEMAAAGSNNPNPDTAVTLTLPVFLFASFAVTAVGLMIGSLELIVFNKMFRKESFFKKILYKFLVYTLFLFLIICVTYPIASALEFKSGLFNEMIWRRFGRFLLSITFLSTAVQMGFSLLLSLLYAGISENLGHSVLMNFFTGKYHSPKEEERIFMFLDMRSSTTIAERLGHLRYFNMLGEYYDDMADAIVRHGGEVYQHVGDEVVISWPIAIGLEENACVLCFFAMKEDIAKRSAFYQETFDVVPSFKAGMHFGEVTTGEIGALKKEIVFTGDVLNATARIQALCNTYESDLLISGELMAQLTLAAPFTFHSLGTVHLSGRKEQMQLFSISKS